ncbi:diguanylate cyclase [Gluconacetobacter diazotrophicus PA1 5]|uniref:Diguanylate cyclase n=2 Tax=Gluconacetobacter diazotrophicus TaxID=33996 RepID=A0A7W4I4S2_GLUDI|nr:diguanylate cyclase [Gluconacetobacter diazotrophicus]ACI50929.1 diguanylate cyclase [Gluconacetobacter diazotrophicus PA1 5]MBB2156136.1 diguanylate cyclase [Gluconacetobacter diazotrophicus]TWB08616.1 diguanylate cyclase (GGDEF)-like protein [Gluconacetobacter diazotrophicus]CAP54816.1 putative signalling protein, GGDEF family [Gluconacetobacter diazotrophicus PA1 5]
MEHVFSQTDFIVLEVLALLASFLSFGVACALRQNNGETRHRKILKALLPIPFGTTLWTIHFTAMLRTVGSENMSVSIVHCLASFAIVMAGVFLSLKVIDRRFPYSNYIAGFVFGLGIVLSHIINKNSIHSLHGCPTRNVHNATDILGVVLLGLSFVLLWSSILGYFLDYYGTKKVLSHLKSMATTDRLTGLANRNCLDEQFPDILKNAKHRNRTIGCLIVDLNNFKDINDQYGHLCGDEVLRTMGKNLGNHFRHRDIFIARLGGDEFVALCPYDNMEGLQTCAQELRDLLCQPSEIESMPLTVGCSIGISLFPSDGDTQNILMKKADQAMYEIKKKRISGISFYRDLPRP